MPVLKSERPTKKISLPSTEGAEIEIYDSLLVSDLTTLDTSKSDVEQMLDWLPKLIKRWNFTNDKGEDLPVTREYLMLLKASDIQVIMAEIQKFNQEVKKN